MRSVCLLTLLLVGCSASASKQTPAAKETPTAQAPQPPAVATTKPVQSIEVAQFQKALQQHPEYVLLDVRTPAEYSSGHLNGATMLDFHAPDFDQQVAKLDQSKTYLVYCRTGNRSSKTCQKLSALNVPCYNLAGGITAWRAAQLPTTQP